MNTRWIDKQSKRLNGDTIIDKFTNELHSIRGTWPYSNGFYRIRTVWKTKARTAIQPSRFNVISLFLLFFSVSVREIPKFLCGSAKEIAINFKWYQKCYKITTAAAPRLIKKGIRVTMNRRAHWATDKILSKHFVRCALIVQYLQTLCRYLLTAFGTPAKYFPVHRRMFLSSVPFESS